MSLVHKLLYRDTRTQMHHKHLKTKAQCPVCLEVEVFLLAVHLRAFCIVTLMGITVCKIVVKRSLVWLLAVVLPGSWLSNDIFLRSLRIKTKEMVIPLIFGIFISLAWRDLNWLHVLIFYIIISVAVYNYSSIWMI